MDRKEQMSKLKKELIEEMGVYFESQDILSPLSSRIFALLALVGYDGVTFDEIVEELEVSKSSVSTNLQLLQSMGRISYYTKPGDRKRYFKISVNDMVNRLDDKIDSWQKERKLHEKVANYRKEIIAISNKTNSEIQKDLSFNIHYIEFVDKMIENLQKLKTNILITINQEK
ncbi:GbsR/MarR family transcriptional regulator [Galbibacter pacificus]|uniref:Helix-turn-helix domain-containing protein n=1 Tax=Galbibacter pacificus TaxID=2996052 RepID=A0ABT6FTS7_9FLAO|nr:helix-turn-helix domain-containing protein [Galbibacter pacificus]MDG3583165.1 helix-turn-helix domain-containing protein [Galbibacter pacificus]MDG3586646.1 helix-turn-helix domain-containing protein [Galbibacter pacificus]